MSEEKRLLELLNENHKWPSLFAFKFIVPVDKGQELEALFPEAVKKEVRPSSGGKYSAYTLHCPMGSGEEVLLFYARAKQIPGLLAL
jgi:hypothetical protein